MRNVGNVGNVTKGGKVRKVGTWGPGITLHRSSRSIVPHVPSFLTFLTFLSACSPETKTEAVADWRRVPVSIELRPAKRSPGPELVPAAVHGQRNTVYLHPEAGLSNTDIARVEAIKSRIGQGLILEVWLTSAGARRIADLTGRHIGEGLAILINSVVVSVPTIQDRLNPGTRMPFKVGVPLGPKEAGQLAHAVSQTWGK